MLKFNIAFSSAATFIGMLLNFGFKVYLARQVEKEELIVYYLILDLVLISSYLFVGYKDAFIRIFNRKVENPAMAFSLANWFIIGCVIVTALIVLPLAHGIYLAPRLAGFEVATILLGLLLAGNALINHINNSFFAYAEYRLAAGTELIASVAIIIAFFALLLAGDMPTYLRLIYATLGGYLFTLVFQALGLRLRLSQQFSSISSMHRHWQSADRSEFLSLTNLASLEYFANRLPLFATPFLMLQFYAMDDLGDYQVVARPIYLALVAVCIDPIYRILFPEFSRMIADKQIQRILDARRRFTGYLVLFSIVLFGGTWLLAEPVIIWLFTETYGSSHLMLSILVLAIPLGCYRAMSFALLKGAGMFRQTMGIRLMGAFAFIAVVIAGSLLDASVEILIYGILASVAVTFVLSLVSEIRLLNRIKMT